MHSFCHVVLDLYIVSVCEHVEDVKFEWFRDLGSSISLLCRYTAYVFVSFPQKRNGIVFSSGVNYLHSGGNIQSEKSS